MTCVWATHLELTWGIFAARSLVNQMTQWAMRVLKPKICHRLTLIIRRSLSRRSENRAATPNDGFALPHQPIKSREQTSNLQSAARVTPSRFDFKFRGNPSNMQALQKEQQPCISAKGNDLLLAAPRNSSGCNEPAYISPTNDRSTNEELKAPGSGHANGPSSFALSKPWPHSIPISMSAANILTSGKEQQATGTRQGSDPISPLFETLPKEKNPTLVLPCNSRPATEEGQQFSSSCSGFVASSAQPSKENHPFYNFLGRSKSTSANDQEEPTVLPRTPDSDASELFSDPSSKQSDNRDTPSLEVNREKHGSPCQGKESSSSKPDTPSLPRGVLGSIEPSYRR
jgi:hypothetical protein